MLSGCELGQKVTMLVWRLCFGKIIWYQVTKQMQAFDGLNVLTTFFFFPFLPLSLSLFAVCVCNLLICLLHPLMSCLVSTRMPPPPPPPPLFVSLSLFLSTTTSNSSSSCKLSIFLTATDLQCPSPLTLRDFSLLESRPSVAVPASWRCLVLWVASLTWQLKMTRSTTMQSTTEVRGRASQIRTLS